MGEMQRSNGTSPEALAAAHAIFRTTSFKEIEQALTAPGLVLFDLF